MIVEGDLQPLKRFVLFTATGISLGNLISQAILSLGDQLRQGRVRRLPLSTYVVSERMLETSKRHVRLQFCFTQSAFAVISLHRDQRLPSVTRRGSRLYFCHCAPARVCVIQFAGIEQRATDLELRRHRRWVEFYCRSGLALRLSHAPQINHVSR